MSEEQEVKKIKITVIAEELSISAADILAFLKDNNMEAKSHASKVTEEIRLMILDHFQADKKMSDAQKKYRVEQERKKKQLAAKSSGGDFFDDPSKRKSSTQKLDKLFSTKSDTALETELPLPLFRDVPPDDTPTVKEEPILTPIAEVPTPPPAPELPKHGGLKVTGTLPIENFVKPKSKSVSPEPSSKSLGLPAQDRSTESASTPLQKVAKEPETVTNDEPLTPVSSAVDEPVPPVESTPPEHSTEDSAEREAPLSPVTEDEAAAPVAETPLQSVEQNNSLYNQVRADQDSIKTTERTNIAGLTVVDYRTRAQLGLEEKKKKKDKKKSLGERQVEQKTFTPAAPAAPSATKKPDFPAASSDKIPPKGDKVEAAKPAKGKKKNEVDQRKVERNIRQTISDMDESSDSANRQRFRRRKAREREERLEEAARQLAEESKSIRITEYATPHEFADKVGVTPKEVIEKCFRMGKFITINQRLDKETIEILALEFGKEVLFISDIEATEVEEEEDIEPVLKSRPPVVTIMGHVDHGKTSLLDYIRRSNVVAGESGGITQHIGAYEVTIETGQHLTFLDTPGHEAFTAMRARGAQVTDIVILVVAADDSVMPQTLEAISHAKAANVPIVVAINKIDKPEANPDKIRTQLSENGVLVEEWGGDVQCQEISAKKGLNVRELLDKVLVQSELMTLQADYNEDRLARGVIVEAELDKGKGIIATVLVQQGILKVGDPFIAGAAAGKVRALLDERGNRRDEVLPSQPVRVLGFEELPEAGDIFHAMATEREARDIAQRRQLIRREQEFRARNRMKLDDISQAGIKELRIVLKADVGGSLEALAEGLLKVQIKEVKIQIIHRGIGQITESDVLLAAASDAIIIGFRVRPNLKAKQLAERESIDIRFYTVIYHAIEEVEKALEGMLAPEFKEEVTATVEIRNVFRISKFGNVAGCFVLEGKMQRDSKVRLLRDGVQIYDGELSSLKRFKDDVKEIASGFECGLTLRNYDDIKVGDIIEAVQTVETKRKLVHAEAR